MTTVHKIVLSLIATVCISLIVFYSIKGNNRQPQPVAVVVPGPDGSRSPGEDEGKTQVDDGARARAMREPVIVGPSAANPPAGLDELVARVRSEIATNEPVRIDEAAAAAAPGPTPTAIANAPTAIELAEASGPSSSVGSVAVPPVALTTAAPDGGSVEDHEDFADIVPVDLPDASTADAPKANDDAGVPTFTLGEPPRKTLAADAADEIASNDAGADAPATRDLFEGRIAEITGRREPLPPLVQIRSNEESTVEAEATPKVEPVVRVDDGKVGTGIVVEPHAAANGPSAAPRPIEAAKPAATPAASSTRKTYTVKPGDSFSSIALRELGAERHWLAIVDANPGVDPKRIKVGQVIALPVIDGDEARPAAPVAAGTTESNGKAATVKPAITADAKPGAGSDAKPAATGEAKIHEVRAGENLSSISRRHFNTPDHWRHIYITNREIIGGDPGRLHAGLKLKITTPKAD